MLPRQQATSPVFLRAKGRNIGYFYWVKISYNSPPGPQQGLLHLMNPSFPFHVKTTKIQTKL